MVNHPQNQKILGQNGKILDSGLCLKSMKSSRLVFFPEFFSILEKTLDILEIATVYQLVRSSFQTSGQTLYYNNIGREPLRGFSTYYYASQFLVLPSHQSTSPFTNQRRKNHAQ